MTAPTFVLLYCTIAKGSNAKVGLVDETRSMRITTYIRTYQCDGIWCELMQEEHRIMATNTRV